MRIVDTNDVTIVDTNDVSSGKCHSAFKEHPVLSVCDTLLPNDQSKIVDHCFSNWFSFIFVGFSNTVIFRLIVYPVCHGFRLMKLDDYFLDDIDHF